MNKQDNYSVSKSVFLIADNLQHLFQEGFFSLKFVAEFVKI